MGSDSVGLRLCKGPLHLLPDLRFVDGRYYMMYCEALPGPEYPTYMVRSNDLARWESSPLNPVMKLSDDDHTVAGNAQGLTTADRDRIVKGANVCNSDVDLCEFEARWCS